MRVDWHSNKFADKNYVLSINTLIKKETDMKSIRYHLICELNKRWNVAFGIKMFDFKVLKTNALLALDECQSLQEVKNLMNDYRRYDMLSTTSGSQSAFYN